MKICFVLICLVLIGIGTWFGVDSGKFSCTKNDGEDQMYCSYRFGLAGVTESIIEFDSEVGDGFSQIGEGVARYTRNVKHEEMEVFYPLLGRGNGVKLGWEADEDEKYLYLMVGMPGLNKENVTITVEHNTTLVIYGNGDKESFDAHGRTRSYRIRFHVPESHFNLSGSGGFMENGALRFMVPKVKKHINNDVFHVSI